MDIFIKLTMKESQRFQICQKLINKKITTEEARKMMNLKSKRQVRRIKARVIKEGIKGISHRSRGKPSNRKYTDEFINKVLDIYDSDYHDFKPTYASEKLSEKHNIEISSEWLRLLLINKNRWKSKSRRKPKKRHVWRQRKSNYGEMQQFDGSYHKWFENRAEECCLLLSVDDATGKITKAKLDKNEGTVAVFKFWKEYIETNEIPCSIYLDKFSTYKVNHKNAVDNKDLITQFQRASNQIGMKLITANSPEAKGRVERMNSTLQDRLVKELRLKSISTTEEANKFIKEEFIPSFNKKFAVIPREKANLHKPINKELKSKLSQIFSIQNTRKVMNDYTIMFKNQFFQLNETQPTAVFKKDTVTVEEHLNGEVKINLKGYYLNHTVLPERPKKTIDIPLCALTNKINKSQYWSLPKDHPWRKFRYSKESNTSKNPSRKFFPPSHLATLDSTTGKI